MKITDEMIEAAKEAYRKPRLMIPNTSEGSLTTRINSALEAALAVAPEPVDHSELIAEAEGRGCPYETCTCDGRLIRRLADALEGKTMTPAEVIAMRDRLAMELLMLEVTHPIAVAKHLINTGWVVAPPKNEGENK